MEYGCPETALRRPKKQYRSKRLILRRSRHVTLDRQMRQK